MTTSERAITNLTESDQPISEQFRITAKLWVDADAAASLLEELKSTTLETMKSKLITVTPALADNAAKRQAQCDPEWEKYIRDMVEQRRRANRYKVQMEYLRIRNSEWIGRDATARAEMKL